MASHHLLFNINVNPDYAEFGIDLRAQENNVMKRLIQWAKHAVIMQDRPTKQRLKVASMVAPEPCQERKLVVKALPRHLDMKELPSPPLL